MVVSDSSPLAAFAAIGATALLPALFGAVHIPQAVVMELRAASHLPGRLQLLESPWLIVTPLSNRAPMASLPSGLGAGEAEAIALVLERHATLLVVDDLLGRRTAQGLGVKTIGVIGVVVRAKVNGLIPAAKPMIRSLRDDAGIWISDKLFDLALREAGEL